jgi:hypothetical protein
VLAAATTISLSMIVAGVAKAIGRTAAAIRAMVETLRPSRDVVHAAAGRRTALQYARGRRMVIDDWMMWRM